jgi:hypothetical protein
MLAPVEEPPGRSCPQMRSLVPMPAEEALGYGAQGVKQVRLVPDQGAVQ